MIHRVGTFFMLVGIGLIVLFVASDVSGAPACNFLVIGTLLLALGGFLWFRTPAPSGPPSGRFRIFKRAGKKDGQK
jgi:hypothetical protein